MVLWGGTCSIYGLTDALYSRLYVLEVFNFYHLHFFAFVPSISLFTFHIREHNQLKYAEDT